MSKVIRKYKKPDVPGMVTILTDYQVGVDDITLTLSPAEQEIVLKGISDGIQFSSSNILGRQYDAAKHYGYLKFLAKLETLIEAVGIDEHELPGEEYELV